MQFYLFFIRKTFLCASGYACRFLGDRHCRRHDPEKPFQVFVRPRPRPHSHFKPAPGRPLQEWPPEVELRALYRTSQTQVNQTSQFNYEVYTPRLELF